MLSRKLHPIYPHLKWQSTPVLLPGKSHGQRSLVRYSLWGCKELGTTESDFTSDEGKVGDYFSWRPTLKELIHAIITKHPRLVTYKQQKMYFL